MRTVLDIARHDNRNDKGPGAVDHRETGCGPGRDGPPGLFASGRDLLQVTIDYITANSPVDPLVEGRIVGPWSAPTHGRGRRVRQRSTCPTTHETVPPPVQMVPVWSRVMCTRPARPSAVPWLAV